MQKLRTEMGQKKKKIAGKKCNESCSKRGKKLKIKTKSSQTKNK